LRFEGARGFVRRGTERLIRGRGGFEPADGRLQLVCAKEKTLVEQAELIEGDAVRTRSM
jgi:hypothetical protein